LLPNTNQGDGPTSLEDKVHAFRLHLFRRAQELVYRALRRLGLGTSKERLGLLESHSAERAGLLTQR